MFSPKINIYYSITRKFFNLVCQFKNVDIFLLLFYNVLPLLTPLTPPPPTEPTAPQLSLLRPTVRGQPHSLGIRLNISPPASTLCFGDLAKAATPPAKSKVRPQGLGRGAPFLSSPHHLHPALFHPCHSSQQFNCVRGKMK